MELWLCRQHDFPPELGAQAPHLDGSELAAATGDRDEKHSDEEEMSVLDEHFNSHLRPQAVLVGLSVKSHHELLDIGGRFCRPAATCTRTLELSRSALPLPSSSAHSLVQRVLSLVL